MKRFWNASLLFAAVVIGLLTLFTNIDTVNADTPADTTVQVTNFAFTDASITIDQGDTVTWENDGGFHNVASTDGTTFRCGSGGCDQTGGNGAAASGSWTTSFTFLDAGVYNYVCEIHPSMTGTITVTSTTSVALSNIGSSAHNSLVSVLMAASLLCIVTGAWVRQP